MTAAVDLDSVKIVLFACMDEILAIQQSSQVPCGKCGLKCCTCKSARLEKWRIHLVEHFDEYMSAQPELFLQCGRLLQQCRLY